MVPNGIQLKNEHNLVIAQYYGKSSVRLNDNAIEMIDFMLNDLGCPTRKSFDMRDEIPILPANFDVLKTLCFSLAIQAQTAFFGFVTSGLRCDDRIEHFHERAFVVEDDDGFISANHVGRHADAFTGVSLKCVHEVVGYGNIFGSGRFCFEF